jgi:hypothetical protein
MTLTPQVGCAGSANPAQATMAGAGQGKGQTQAEDPPARAATSSQPAASATSGPVPENRRSSTQPDSGCATKKSVCLQLSYQTRRTASLLKMTIFRPLLRRKRSARTGVGYQDYPWELAVARTSPARRQHRCKSPPTPISAIFTFIGKKVVYTLANLGSSTALQHKFFSVRKF